MHGPKAAIGKSPCPVGHLEAKVAGPEHGPSLGTPLAGPQSSLVAFAKRAHNPLLLAAGLDKTDVAIPWLGDKRLRLAFG